MLLDKEKQFIEKAKHIHKNIYDYSKVRYIGSRTKVCIICPEHGEFWQTPNSHLNRQGCPKCGIIKAHKPQSLTKEEFILKAREVHGWKYDYSKVKYVNNKTNVCIICPEHGEFWQKPYAHLSNQGCPKCRYILSSKKLSFTNNDFIKKAKEIYNNKYDYSKVDYVNNHTKVCIICPEHGEFWQTPNNFLNKHACQKCGKFSRIKKQSLTKEEFILKAREVHGWKYDYSKVDYKNYKTKVCIICPEHGEFWQTPDAHLSNQGCYKCKHSKLEDLV